MQKGTFVVFEGISACGKSEYIKKTIDILKKNNQSYYLYEWNSNRFFRWLVEYLEKHNHLSATGFTIIQYLSFLYDLLFKLFPASKKYDYVLCDRYIYTGMIRDICNFSKMNPFMASRNLFFVPDFIFYIKVDPSICHYRIMIRNKRLRYFGDNPDHPDAALTYLKRCERQYDLLFQSMDLPVIEISNTCDGNSGELEVISCKVKEYG